jgi:parallel beta-helix repeat protein
MIEAMEQRLLFAVVLTVTNTNNSGDGSLRAAINNANVVPIPQSATILFNIPGKGVHTIKPASALPTITVQVDIEGTTDSVGDPLIELDGEGAGGNVNGLVFNRNTNSNDKPSVVSGLIINRFTETGITIDGSAPTDVFGCWMGTDFTGEQNAGNGGGGIVLTNDNNQIGLAGNGAGFKTIISGNGGDQINIVGNNNIVQNCFVGTDVTGKQTLNDQEDGINISGSYNLIGGTRPGEGNLVSGNQTDGIFIGAGQFNTILSNEIAGNFQGIVLISASNNEIGDGSDADRNLINDNEGVGVGMLDSNDNQVSDNIIGTASSATAAQGNNGNGVTIGDSSGNTLSDDTIDDNNGDGIEIAQTSGTATGNTIDKCFIGTDAKKDNESFLENQGDGIDLDASTATEINNNVIYNSGLDGIHITDSSGNALSKNTILGSGHDGVRMIDSSNNSLDSAIIGNSRGDGVLIQQSTGDAENNSISNSFIGTNDANDDQSLPNRGNGINVLGATNTDVESSYLFNNGLAGMEVNGGTANGDRFREGGIFNNHKLGISIGDNTGTDHPNEAANVGGIGAPDNAVNHPVLSSAVVDGDLVNIAGSLVGFSNTNYFVYFFQSSSADPSGFGQGQIPFDTFDDFDFVTTDGSGNANFTAALPGQFSSGQVITAIAITQDGNDMSEFSNAVKVTGASISGSVFNDANGNGKQDAGEKGLSKQIVFVYTQCTGVFDKDFDSFATTNSNGNFSLFGPPTGIIHLDLAVASSFVQTTPSAKKPFYKLTIVPISHTGALIFGEMQIKAKAASRGVISAPLAASAASMFEVGSDDHNRTPLEELL